MAVPQRRLWEIDALRGLMLVLMTVTHIPTRLSDPFGQPFGFVSAAEGFVLLSGFVAGMVYAQRLHRDGDEAMRGAFMARAVKLYAIQACLLLFLLAVVAVLGVATGQSAITDMVSYFLERPVTALVGGLLLLYNPPLLDILPMYVIFMIVSPLLLLNGERYGWNKILAGSVLLWLAAQFGLSPALHQKLVEWIGMPIPFRQTGAFEMLAWQMLWVIGLWMGARQARGRPAQPSPFPRWAVAFAVVYAGAHLLWRHIGGQSPFHGDAASLNVLYDKWRLGPLRLLDLFSLMVLAMHFGPSLAERVKRLPLLEMLGRQSLPVFVAHVVVAVLVLALRGPIDARRPYLQEVTLLAGAFALLWLVGRLGEAFDRHTAAVKRRINERRLARRARRASRGAPRSPVATTNSPLG